MREQFFPALDFKGMEMVRYVFQYQVSVFESFWKSRDPCSPLVLVLRDVCFPELVYRLLTVLRCCWLECVN